MLVTCLQCRSPVFVSAAALGEGRTLAVCSSCRVRLWISGCGAVALTEDSPPPAPLEVARTQESPPEARGSSEADVSKGVVEPLWEVSAEGSEEAALPESVETALQEAAHASDRAATLASAGQESEPTDSGVPWVAKQTEAEDAGIQKGVDAQEPPSASLARPQDRGLSAVSQRTPVTPQFLASMPPIVERSATKPVGGRAEECLDPWTDAAREPSARQSGESQAPASSVRGSGEFQAPAPGPIMASALPDWKSEEAEAEEERRRKEITARRRPVRSARRVRGRDVAAPSVALLLVVFGGIYLVRARHGGDAASLMFSAEPDGVPSEGVPAADDLLQGDAAGSSTAEAPERETDAEASVVAQEAPPSQEVAPSGSSTDAGKAQASVVGPQGPRATRAARTGRPRKRAPKRSSPASKAKLMTAGQYYRQGNLYVRQGKYAQAVEQFRACLTLEPNYARAYRSLGVVFMQVGRERNAIEAYTRFLALAPNDPDAPTIRKIVEGYARR